MLSAREMPLPASARLQVSERTPEGLRNFSARVKSVEAVQDVDYGRETVERLLSIFRVARLLLSLVGAMLSVAALLIVSNVARLTVFARREEISIMKLVGAGNFFVRVPFLLESSLEGLAGGLAASAILFGLGRFLAYRVRAELGLDLAAFFPAGVPPLFAAQLAGLGLAMGFVAGLFSVGRYLKT